MKVKENGLDFKFINLTIYGAAFIGLYFFLRNIGIMEKIFKGIAALTPVFVGIIVCWVSMPLVRRLRKIGFGKNISAFIALIIIFGIIGLAIGLLVPILIEQLTHLIKELPGIYSSVISFANKFLMENFDMQTGIDIKSSLKSLDFVEGNLTNALNYSINTVQSVVGFVISFFTAIIISFFMAKDMDKFKENVIAFLSRNSKDDRKHKMIVEIDETCMSYIKGYALDSLIVGILTTIVCLILKIDYAVVFGLLLMIFNFIPYIGAILSYLVVTLYALATGGPVFALITFICMAIIQIIDANILQPNIISKSVNLHPVVVISGLIVFQLLFGIVGMLIAMPVLAGIKVYLKYKFNLDEYEIEEKSKSIKKKQSVKKEKKVVKKNEENSEVNPNY